MTHCVVCTTSTTQTPPLPAFFPTSLLSLCTPYIPPTPLQSVVVAAAAAGDMLEDIDWTEDMPVPVQRRVRALKEVQGEYDTLMREFIKERAALQAKYEKAAGGYAERGS